MCHLHAQVGIAREIVVTMGKLGDLAAAELFIASAPREVSWSLPVIHRQGASLHPSLPTGWSRRACVRHRSNLLEPPRPS